MGMTQANNAESLITKEIYFITIIGRERIV